MNASDPMTPAMRPYLPATADFAAGRDSPRRFLERCLTALEAWEPKVGAFVTLNLAAAREAADRASARWRAGRPLSAIDGMPLGIKDIIETIDMPTENGSPLFAGFRSERDGASVAALREAGGGILGKTVATEFAASEPRGARHPWGQTRTPGGSSSGSAAAVAVGAISVGLGTQVLGSILRPASFCGCFGFQAHGRARPRRGPAGGVAGRLGDRHSRRRRSGLSGSLWSGDAAGHSAPARVPRNGRLDGGDRGRQRVARGGAGKAQIGGHCGRDAPRQRESR